MAYWLQFVALKVGVLTLMLLATALFVLRYPSMWAALMHLPRWSWVPIEAFAVCRVLLPVLLVFGWFAYFMAARRLGRPA